MVSDMTTVVLLGKCLFSFYVIKITVTMDLGETEEKGVDIFLPVSS